MVTGSIAIHTGWFAIHTTEHSRRIAFEDQRDSLNEWYSMSRLNIEPTHSSNSGLCILSLLHCRVQKCIRFRQIVQTMQILFHFEFTLLYSLKTALAVDRIRSCEYCHGLISSAWLIATGVWNPNFGYSFFCTKNFYRIALSNTPRDATRGN